MHPGRVARCTFTGISPPTRLTAGLIPRLFDGQDRMAIRDVLLTAMVERFPERGLRLGTPPEAIAVCPAKHPDVGDLSVRDSGLFTVGVVIGEILSYSFTNYDTHLEESERAGRVTRDVVRFLQELFADRLLIWRSTDGRNGGWRERGDVGYSEPLVLDNRIYRTYLWSSPLSVWQAIPTIFARGRIRDDREHQIILTLLEQAPPDGLAGPERDAAVQLAAQYEREVPSD